MRWLILSLCLGLGGGAAVAQSAAGVLGELARTHQFSEVAMAPDGQQVAWVEDGHVFAERLEAAPLALGEGASLAWSPDSRQLALLSGGQLEVVAASGGARRRLTHLTGYLADPRWSPDGRTIAFLFAANAERGGGPLNPERARTGVIGSVVHNQRLTLVAVAGGAVRPLTPAGLNIYEFDWAPDGKSFCFTAAPGPADNNWWIAQLYTAPRSTGTPHLVFKQADPQGQMAMPRFSPDGGTIAFVQGIMSDEGFPGGDLYTVAAAGGAERDRTPGARVSVSSLQWVGPGVLDVTEYVGGSSQMVRFTLASSLSQVLWSTDQDVHNDGDFGNFSWSRDGRRAAYIRADWAHAPEIFAGPVGQLAAVTHANAGLAPAWGAAKSLTWTNDGFHVQGWLIYPRGYQPGRKYPMVVAVHGGPANLNMPHWPDGSFEPTLLSGMGYFVLFPNPRGSYGQGEAFTKANVKDFGYGDLRDVLAGVDRAIASAPIDPNRLGITGWSYGGYMTMWAITHTRRFRAAVSGAGLSDWQSYWGENQIDQWMTPYFGASIYDDPAVYAKSAPIKFMKDVKTPTLLVVGQLDGECPAPQSFEYWTALKWLGVPTRLVVYPGEGHMFQQPAHIRDVLERTAGWFNQYLK